VSQTITTVCDKCGKVLSNDHSHFDVAWTKRDIARVDLCDLCCWRYLHDLLTMNGRYTGMLGVGWQLMKWIGKEPAEKAEEVQP
jgi:hypothetical protein